MKSQLQLYLPYLYREYLQQEGREQVGELLGLPSGQKKWFFQSKGYSGFMVPFFPITVMTGKIDSLELSSIFCDAVLWKVKLWADSQRQSWKDNNIKKKKEMQKYIRCPT